MAYGCSGASSSSFVNSPNDSVP
jgi:hypothetical protein